VIYFDPSDMELWNLAGNYFAGLLYYSCGAFAVRHLYNVTYFCPSTAMLALVAYTGKNHVMASKSRQEWSINMS